MIGIVFLLLGSFLGGALVAAAASSESPKTQQPKRLKPPDNTENTNTEAIEVEYVEVMHPPSRLISPPEVLDTMDPWHFPLPLGLERFTPVLTTGQEYDIVISGTLRWKYPRSQRYIAVDAFWRDNGQGNFTAPLMESYREGLSIDMERVAHDSTSHQDRERHCYTLRVMGKGEKVALCFYYPPPASTHQAGSMWVHISEVATSLEVRDKAEADRQARLQALIALSEVQPHLADPTYLENFARRHKDRLLKSRAAIIQTYLDAYADLLPWLQDQHPDLIPFACWEAKALAIAERLDVEPVPAPSLIEACDKAEADRQARIQTLIALHELQQYLADHLYLQKYARKHKDALLKSRDAITRAYLDFCTDLLPLLKAHQRDDLIAVATWEARALALAEQLDVEPPPPPTQQPRLTPEEWQVRIERFRQRQLTRKRVKVEDHRADVLQDLEMLQDFIADLDHYPLDEDERERLIQEFKERLLGGDEETGNGFKQLS